MWLVLIPTDSPTEDTMHDLEGGIDALVDAGCTVVEDGESMSSIAADGTCFELHVGTGDDSTFTIDTAGITGMAMYAQHVPTEFERDQHYLKDSAGVDIEPVAQEGAGAHDHGHGEEGHEEHFVCHDMTTHENHDEYTNEADCEAAGHSWMEDAHGEDGPVCHDEATHENHDEYTNEADCEAAGHHWMESGEEEHHHFAMTVVLDDATHHFEVEEDEAPANASGMMDVGMAALNLSVGMDPAWSSPLPAMHRPTTGHGTGNFTFGTGPPGRRATKALMRSFLAKTSATPAATTPQRPCSLHGPRAPPMTPRFQPQESQNTRTRAWALLASTSKRKATTALHCQRASPSTFLKPATKATKATTTAATAATSLSGQVSLK